MIVAYGLESHVQSLILWLTNNPKWALIITFLISFSESLAIVGSIIPGSVTMTAIGILAGSGVMRIDATLIAAILGAIAGDSTSYTLGALFKNQISKIWPFTTHKHWLVNGRDFFNKHGALSVLLGRFIGPLRSVIPLIAGMMQMRQIQFLAANILSAIAWSILYVGPGILIGAASNELSKKIATRLFIIIFAALILTWLLYTIIKWLYLKISSFLSIYLHNLWVNLQKKNICKTICLRITPSHETQHAQTAGLLIIFFVLLLILSTLFIFMYIAPGILQKPDLPLFLAIKSFHTHLFDKLFISMNIITSLIPLLTIITTTIIYAGFYQEWRTMRYWITLLLCSVIIILLPTSGLFKYTVIVDPQITISTALFIFLMLYLKKHYSTLTINFLSITLFFITIFASFAKIYLGFTTTSLSVISYLCGLELALLFWIFYRGLEKPHNRSQKFVLFCTICFIASAIIAHIINFNPLVKSNNKPKPNIFIHFNTWWNNDLVYKYTKNRFGKNLSLLNVQYVGSLIKLRQNLEKNNWHFKKHSFLNSLLLKVSGKNDYSLKTQLYLNKKPIIILIYNIKDSQNTKIILKIWHSRYKVVPYNMPLWIGNISVIPKHNIYIDNNLIAKYFMKSFKNFNTKLQNKIYKLAEDNSEYNL